MNRNQSPFTFVPPASVSELTIRRGVGTASAVGRRYSRASSTGATLQCSVRVPLPGNLPNLQLSVAPALAYGIYLPYIMFFSSAQRLGDSPEPVKEAIALSVNFDFFLPIVFPSIAPELSPVLEAIFNSTVAYATLFLGFSLDKMHLRSRAQGHGGHSDEDVSVSSDSFSPDSELAALLVPLLTNIVWLPYLALRGDGSSRSSGSSGAQPTGFDPFDHRGARKLLHRVSQSRGLPIYGCVIMIFSIVYGIFAHASGDLPADLHVRVHELQRLCNEDILVSSFAADWIAFAIFQGWLVKDDVSLRGWDGSRAQRAALAARFIPFFGLAWYLFERAQDPRAKKF